MKIKMMKQPLKDILVEGVGLVAVIGVSTLINEVISAVLPVDMKKTKKIACYIGGCVVSAMVCDKAATYLKTEARPVINAVVDSINTKEDYPEVQIPSVKFETEDDMKFCMEKMRGIFNKQKYITVGDFLEETVEDSDINMFSDEVKNEWGWVEPELGGVYLETTDGFIFKPKKCVHISKGDE